MIKNKSFGEFAIYSFSFFLLLQVSNVVTNILLSETFYELYFIIVQTLKTYKNIINNN